jgi:hypothetical protein
VADLSRSELQDWLERVARRAPQKVGYRQKKRVKAEPNVKRWCVDAPGDTLAVLEDESELRAAVTIQDAEARIAQGTSADIRQGLRERFAPFPEELAQLEVVLAARSGEPGVVEAVAAFVNNLETLRRQEGKVEKLASQVDGDGGEELLESLREARSNPRLVGRLMLGLKLAQKVDALERRATAADSKVEKAPDRLNNLLAEQAEAIQQQESQMVRLDEQLEASRNERLKIAAQLEHEEHLRELIQADLDRLDAKFDILLARARMDPTLDAQELYETYRERTDRQRVWRERAKAEAHAEELRIALRSLQLQHRDLRHELDECAGERSRLIMQLDELQSAVNELSRSNHELQAWNAELLSDVEAARWEAEHHKARSEQITGADLTPAVVQALHGAGIYTLGALADGFPHEVDYLPNIGPAKLQRIEDVLISRGLR